MGFSIVHVVVRHEEDVVLARSRAVDVAEIARLHLQERTRFVTAVLEIVRNAFQYAGGANVHFEVETGNNDRHLCVIVEDAGPGIENLDEILNRTNHPSTGMGLGITGVKRLVDYFHVDSNPGQGTTVTLGVLIPPGLGTDPKTLIKWREELAKKRSYSFYEELRHHNQELLQILEELSRKDRQFQEQLVRLEEMNRELEQTNNGIIALHTELKTKNEQLEQKNKQLSREIREREKAEKSVRESEKRYRVLVENVRDGIVLLHERVILYVNPTFAKLLGYTVDELVGKDFCTFVHKDYRAKFISLYGKKSTGNCSDDCCELDLVTTEGREVETELLTSDITDQGRRETLLLVRDIMTRRLLEEERLKSSKLESIGILAGGIAHDFNNLLTVIMGNITLSQMKLGKHSEIIRYLKDAEKASLMAKDIAYKFLTFSSGVSPILQSENVREVIVNTVQIAMSGSPVKRHIKIPDDLWKVYCDLTQFQQALTNVLLNVKDAMPQGGNLYVKAENVRVMQGEIPVFEEGDYVRIMIVDEGCGIPEEHLSKIFDPYFSTKERSTQKGMGLGLTITYSIMKNHGGYIDVKSRPGKGTTVELYFKVANKEPAVQTLPDG